LIPIMCGDFGLNYSLFMDGLSNVDDCRYLLTRSTQNGFFLKEHGIPFYLGLK
jgi:hypothetical protein